MSNNANNNPDDATIEPAHHRWLPIEALTPGMILDKSVHVAQHGVLIMKLGEGTELKENTIDQLFSRGVECVSIRDNSTPDESHIAALINAHQERLLEIFACKTEADVPPNCRDLFNALLKAGPYICHI